MNENFKKSSSSGQTLMIIMGIMIIFMIIIPALVFMVQSESRWTAKQSKTSRAFHAAEAGADRGKWKLAENTANWESVIYGTPISGYDDDVTYDIYSDSAGTKLSGQYKVDIFAGPDPGEITIRSKGRDPTNSAVRCIEIVMSKAVVDSAMNIDGDLSWKPNLDVHWGPIVSFTDITGLSSWYPRKYSIGQIDPRDSDPTAPNSDGKEFWAFEDLGTGTQIDLPFYRDIAKKSSIPTSCGGGTIKKATGAQLAVSSPTGSGYFLASQNNGGIRLFGGYKFRSSTCVIYTDGTLDGQTGSFVQLQAMIGEGNVDFKGDGVSFTANVPPQADLEYVKQKEINPSYNYPGEGSATYGVTNCGMHGFLYCGGNLNSAGGNATLVGSAKIIGEVSFNTFKIYYDLAVSSSVRVSNATARQISWKEVQTTW